MSQEEYLSSSPTPDKVFDWAACHIQKCLVIMLADGNSWLNSVDGQLRQALTIVSVFHIFVAGQPLTNTFRSQNKVLLSRC